MEEKVYKIMNNQLTYGRGYVYSLQYHIVWCTKYRRQVLKNGADTDCKALLQELAEEYRFRIAAMEVMPDHIHQETVPASSGDEEEAVGRAPVEPILLCRHRK